MCPNYQKVVETIDSSLNFVENLSKWYPAYLVFHVKDKTNKQNYVLKACNETVPPKKIDKEIRTLKLASDVKNIPNLIKDYGIFSISLKSWRNAEYHAILKEYMGGEKVEYFTKSARLSLEETVSHLHERGIANLDISSRNILISPDQTRAMLFDFDISVFKQNIPRSDFQYFKKLDILNLTGLFQYFKSKDTIKKVIPH